MTAWVLAAVVIVLVLAAVAAYMQYLVYQQNRRNDAARQVREQQAQAQRQRINESIQIIARAVETDQDLTLTEASIRISVLLDSLGVDDEVREEFSPFYQLHQATGHIPILDGWKNLSAKERNSFDRERAEHEGRYREFVLDAARRIQGREF